jgi:hypothetical protein
MHVLNFYREHTFELRVITVLVLKECNAASWTVTAAQATVSSGADRNREFFVRSWQFFSCV